MGKWICWLRGNHNDRLMLRTDAVGCWTPIIKCLRCHRVQSW